MQVWNSHTWALSTHQLQFFKNLTGKRKYAETRSEGVRYSRWREHTWEKRFISSQVKSQGQFQRQGAGGWSFNLLQQHTSLLWPPSPPQSHQATLSTSPPPPPTGTTVTRLTGVPLIRRLIWGIILTLEKYLSLNYDKNSRIRYVLQKCLVSKTFINFKIQRQGETSGSSACISHVLDFL